jgi:hypothetical protein
LNPVKAHTVVQRQPARRLPGILKVKLQVGVSILAGCVLRRLVKGSENAYRRIGKTEASIQRVTRAVAKIELTAGIGE